MPNNRGKTEVSYPLFLVALLLVLSLILTKSYKQVRLPWFKTSETSPNPVTILPPKAAVKAKISILLYHYVEIVTDKNDYLRSRLAVTPTNFENQLLSLKKSGYTFYFTRDIGLILRGGLKTKPVIITFDDGYGDFYTDVFPILKRQNAKATVFINSGLMGKSNYMTTEQVTEVLTSGIVEIGGHGFSHQNLTGVPIETAKKIIDDDAANIKVIYKITPVSFAYPYGTYNNELKKLVSDAGYKYAVTLEKGWTVQENALMEIPRIRPGLSGTSALGDFLDSL
jgi:peptidoglycan/xylan/chitin deacetylase (PgdA/CDA1 family)